MINGREGEKKLTSSLAWAWAMRFSGLSRMDMASPLRSRSAKDSMTGLGKGNQTNSS